MSLTINAKTYNQHAISANSIVYAGPSHTFTVKDLCTLGRQVPTATPTFRGNARSSLKLVRTLTLDDGKVSDAIVNISYQIPVGCTAADIHAMSDDIGALLSSATIDDITDKQDITW